MLLNKLSDFHTTVVTLRHLEMNVLTPKKSGELISKLAKNVFILPDGIKNLAHEVSSENSFILTVQFQFRCYKGSKFKICKIVSLRILSIAETSGLQSL